MTSRLIVDDNRSRRHLRSGQDTGWHARTAAHAIELIENGHIFQELHLDHDLADQIDIWPLIDYLAERAHDGNPWVGKIFVHSQNPSGVPRMIQALERWNYDVTRVAGLEQYTIADFDSAPELASVDAGHETAARTDGKDRTEALWQQLHAQGIATDEDMADYGVEPDPNFGRGI